MGGFWKGGPAPLCPSVLDRRRQVVAQARGELDRRRLGLDQVLARPELEALTDDLRLAKVGEDQDRDPGKPGIDGDRAEDVQAGQLGQPDIEQDQVGWRLLDLLEPWESGSVAWWLREAARSVATRATATAVVRRVLRVMLATNADGPAAWLPARLRSSKN